MEIITNASKRCLEEVDSDQVQNRNKILCQNDMPNSNIAKDVNNPGLRVWLSASPASISMSYLQCLATHQVKYDNTGFTTRQH